MADQAHPGRSAAPLLDPTLYELASQQQDLQEQEHSIDFRALFALLRIGRRTILFCGLTCLLAALAIAFLLPPRYTSHASFIPPNLSSGGSAAALAGQLSLLGAGDLLGGGKSSAELYAGILRSRSIAEQLVQHFDLLHVYNVKKESQAEHALDANTDLTVEPKSTIVTISVTDTSASRAQAIANAYLDALRTTEGRLSLSQSAQKRLFFGQQLAKEKDDLEDAEVELKKTEEQSGLIAPAGQTESEIKTIAETQAQLALRQVQLAALRQSETDQGPDVVRLRSELQDLQSQLNRLQSGSGLSRAAAIPTSKVPELQLQYVRKEREVKYHEALFAMLSQQYEAAHLEEARDAPILQILDSASYPDTKSSPRRIPIVLGGALLGLLGGCIWVLIRERWPAVGRRSASIPPA